MSDQTIQWSALYRLPTGEQLEEIGRDRADAAARVRNINRDFNQDVAHLAYRKVSHGPWTTDGAGDEWAVHYRWRDGRESVEPEHDRRTAEAMSRLVRDRRESRTPVSRSVTYGQWWLADAAVTA